MSSVQAGYTPSRFVSLVVLLLLAVTVLVGCVQVSQALTVHLVPHTHDDVGWLKTVDEYYSGQNNSIYHASVKYILDSVVQALSENPERKFVYVEQAFFQRWWRQQDEATRNLTRSLVQNGQLEFINGGWSMHDEAAAHYVDMVDQTTVGHKYLLDEFGPSAIPTIGWQVDPFGHSSTQAALLSAEAGFDGLFFGRIDYQDHNIRMASQDLEFVWRASASLGAGAQVLAVASLSGNYGPPPGFCWDAVHCGDEPVQDDPNLEDYNVPSRVNDFVKAALNQAASTKGDLDTMNIMFQMGVDFLYEYANEYFKNMDKIIKAVNADGRVKALYSTPAMYVKAKNAEPIQLSVKTDDFFPYADSADSYWSGYFTSRPALKKYVRMASAFLQAVRQFEVLSGGNGTASQTLWEAQGVLQHHDAVSGTSNQHVAYDYAKQVSIGLEEGAAFIGNVLGSNMDYDPCFYKNISNCPATQMDSGFVATYWNSQARDRTEVVLIPVNSTKLTVYNSTGGVIPSQLLQVPTNQATKTMIGASPYSLAVQLQLQSLTPTGIIVKPSSEHEMSTMSFAKASISDTVVDATISIKNEHIQLNFDSASGLLVNLTDLETGTVYPFTQELAFYYAAQTGAISDAYAFRPAESTPTPIRSNGQVQTSVINSGSLVQEVQQIFNSWATQIVRLRANTRYVEFEWVIGPIDISDGNGKEVISRYNTTLNTNGGLFTDSNGREFLQRVRNQRPTWKWDATQPVSGNYYPLNGIVGFDDGETAFAVNLDRAQGCSSLTDGTLECMLHRRLLYNGGGSVEPLNETMIGILPDGTRLGEGLVITGSHYVQFAPLKQIFDVARPLQDRIFQAPLPFFSSDLSAESLRQVFTAIPSRLAGGVQFPINVELMTVQAWNDGQVLVRLSHQFGINEGSVYNVPATVDLQKVFASTITSITELSLTANQLVDNHKPYIWNTTVRETAKPRARVPLIGTSVTLNPLEIRTFAISLSN